MRVLFFDAVAPNPQVAGPLASQAEKTLRPFTSFLSQAIRTAKLRQVRYQLPWAKVDGHAEISLSAIDHRVLVPRREPAWLITDWPADLEPDAGRKLMVVSRDLILDVVEYGHTADGLRFRPAGELHEDDVVSWCGRSCTIAREPAASAPSAVTDLSGAPLRLVHRPEFDERGWLLVLRDWSGNGDLVVDGERIMPRVLSPEEGLRRLRDEAGRSFELHAGKLITEDPPADGLLTGDNGIRFRWRSTSARRGGAWVQLLPPSENDSADEDFIDPRAAFCEGDVQEVLTSRQRNESTVFKVKKVDADRYQLLLERFPPEGSSLLLPVNINNLQLQQRALRQLVEAPMPHHQGLLRLCENPGKVRWPVFQNRWPERWLSLTDETRSGTEEQRIFVAKALGTPDIAILEGPPGSGKTTAICELIQQLVADGKRVLLCASTHVAIDNVLERLIEADAPIEAVRVGRTDRIDPKVQATQIDEKVTRLVDTWRDAPNLATFGDGELKDMATRVVVTTADLTCGTTMGIVRHPLFHDRDQDLPPWERPIATIPHWDVLIVDEASKTLIQEFLVPALMAQRWIVVGDVQQLPPFTERADIVANLRGLVDERGREVFPPERQRACWVLYRLARKASWGTAARWLVVEPPGVLDRLEQEVRYRPDFPLSLMRVVSRRSGPERAVQEVTVGQIRAGAPEALALAAYDWVLVADDLLRDIADHLPGDLLHSRDLTRGEHGLPESHPLLFRHAWWLAHTGPPRKPYKERGVEISSFDGQETHEQRRLADHDIAEEIAWRLTRIHELKRSSDQWEPERLAKQLLDLQPAAADISEPIAEIQDIGLPSILELLQEGIGTNRANRESALTEGMPRRQSSAFRARFESLSYQHRMHPIISDFPRLLFYGGKSLLDANTIEARDHELEWNFEPFRGRRVWVDVRGHEQRGRNQDEVDVARGIVTEFLAWAKEVGPPRRRSPRLWEVACLCFYTKQEQALSEMLGEVTGDKRRTRFTAGDVELVCGTVDRFQGREADLVLVSMRNTRRVGFLDSRNRLNVAVTRARQQLVVIGNAGFFGDERKCAVPELVELVKRSPWEDGRRWLRRGR